MNISVKPKREGLKLSHPTAGPLRDAPDAQGRWSQWPADQFTFRRIRDGDIEQVEPAADATTAPAAPAAPAAADTAEAAGAIEQGGMPAPAAPTHADLGDEDANHH